MIVEFQLEWRNFAAFSGGPRFKLAEATSFVVSCKNQAEVDYFWAQLPAGCKVVQCGWLKDKFGVSWQIVPTILGEVLGHATAKEML